MSRPLDPRLLRAVPRLRRLLAAYAAVQAVGVVAAIAAAVLVADSVTAMVVRHEGPAVLTGRLVALGVALAVRAATGAAQEWIAARGSYRVRADLRAAVLDAVRRLGPGWAQRQPAGRLVTAAASGLDGLDGYVARALPALVGAAVVPVGVLAFIAVTDWGSALILLLVLPLVPLFMALVGLTTSRQMRERYALLARMSGQFLDLVSGLTTLRVYGAADRQLSTVRRLTDAFRRQTMATLRTAFLSSLVLDLVATLSVALVAVDVGLRLDHGSTDLRTALIVLLLAPELFAPLRALGAQHHASEAGTAAAAAALDVLDEAADRPEPVAGAPVRPTGAVRIRDLTVRHDGADTDALRDVVLGVRPGELVALRGRSGAGKSTLLAALLGFVEPSRGTVEASTAAGWHPVTDDPTAWRAGVAWLPQRPRPSQPSVGEEVRLGDPSAGPDQVADVLAACAAPPADTALGEDGRSVSAGQLRRVALARALLRARACQVRGDVPLLLLDEPSEDLDAATEQVVADVLTGLAGRATVVMATHSDRLAAIAGHVVVLDHGVVMAERFASREPRPALQVAAAEGHEPATAGPLAAPVGSTPSEAVTTRRHRPVRSLLRDRAAQRRLLVAGLLSGLTGLAGLALTATSLWLICRASQQPNVQVLALAVVGVRTFALARAGLRYAERLVAHDGALRLLGEVRARVFAALVPLTPRGVDLRRGDLLRRFVGDVDAVQDGFVRAVVPAAGAAITAIAAVALAAALVPAAGLALGLALLAGLAGALVLPRALARSGASVAALVARRDAAVTGALAALPELTAYGADAAALEAVGALDAEVAAAARPAASGATAGVAATGLSGAVALPVVLAAAAAAAGAGQVGAVAAAVVVAGVLAGFDALTGLAGAAASWTQYQASATRLAELLDAPVPVPEPAVSGVLPAGSTGLAARAAAFAPTPSTPAVVHDLDLDVRPGEQVGLVGPSGCGKSTVLATALRLLPVPAGRLELRRGAARVPLARVRAADVPPLVAGSLQGDHVFAASLRDNLRVVRPAASDDELDQVARAAGFAAVVTGRPEGWDAPAGPDGAHLSGGERQRLLLARALLADPAVLVLDEPGAHLDRDTEREVLADLLDRTRGRTVLLSTHRRVAGLDRVVALPAGPAGDQPLLSCAP